MFSSKDEKYMKMALDLAAKAKDKTYPNPMVGAVIVKSGKVVGKGYHKKAGMDHAEVAAIKRAGLRCKGAKMYVTLEPCDHHGKTPPCTEAIIKSGIKEVVIAMKDPNPITSSGGIKRLKSAGVLVTSGLMGKEAIDLNRKFTKYITGKMPYVTIKLAQTLDGKIAARDGSSKWISSEASRRWVKKMREDYDAIVIGSNTLVEDDPFLLDRDKNGYDVTRVVVDSRLRISHEHNLIKTANKAPVIIATTSKAPHAKIKSLNGIDGVEVFKIASKEGQVSLRSLLRRMASKGMVNVLIEGGGELVGSLIDEGLVDEALFFVSPKLLGGDFSSVKGRGVKNIKDALDLKDVDVFMLDSDIVVRGTVQRKKEKGKGNKEKGKRKKAKGARD